MKKIAFEAGLVGSGTRDKVRCDLGEQLAAWSSDPTIMLPPDTLATAERTARGVAMTLARSSINPGFHPVGKPYDEVAHMAAGLAVGVESAIYGFDTRLMPTATDAQALKVDFIVQDVVSNPHDVNGLNPCVTALLIEASHALDCDMRLQYHAAQIAVATCFIMDNYWEMRSQKIADALWLSEVEVGRVDDVTHFVVEER